MCNMKHELSLVNWLITERPHVWFSRHICVVTPTNLHVLKHLHLCSDTPDLHKNVSPNSQIELWSWDGGMIEARVQACKGQHLIWEEGELIEANLSFLSSNFCLSADYVILIHSKPNERPICWSLLQMRSQLQTCRRYNMGRG